MSDISKYEYTFKSFENIQSTCSVYVGVLSVDCKGICVFVQLTKLSQLLTLCYDLHLGPVSASLRRMLQNYLCMYE